MPVAYVFDEQRLGSYGGLGQFLAATTPEEFARFQIEARQNKRYLKLFQCSQIEETSLSALSICALLGKKAQLDYLLSLQCLDPGSDDNLPLRLAALKGDLELVNALLRFDGVLNRITVNNNIVLNIAIQNENLALINRFLEFQAIQQEIAVDQNIAFRLAVITGNQGIFDNLLLFPEVLEDVAAADNQALRNAVAQGNRPFVDRLLTFPRVRRKVHAVNNFALKAAIDNGHDDIVFSLVAMPEIQHEINKQGDVFLALAAKKGSPPVVARLLEFASVRATLAIPNHVPFNLSIREGRNTVVDLFLQYREIRNNLARPENQALRIAAAEGRLDILNQLLLIPGVVRYATINKNEALRLAAANGHTDLVARLLEIPEVRDAANDLENEALCISIKNGHEAVARKLLKLPHVRAHAVRNSFALHAAVANGMNEIIGDLFINPVVREGMISDGGQLLLSAAKNGHLSVVRRFLNFLPVSKWRSINDEILYEAATNGRVSVVQELLTITGVFQGPSINYSNIFINVVKNNHTEMALYLLQLPQFQHHAGDEENAALHHAVQNGNYVLVSALIEIENVQANITAKRNRSILRVAVRGNHLEIVRLLLNWPDVVRQINANQFEVLKIIAEKGYIDILNVILGYSHIAEDSFSLICFGLCIACETGQDDIVYRLLELPNVRAKAASFNNRALIAAAKHGHVRIVNALLTIESVSANVATDGNQAFLEAVRNGHTKVVSELLQYENIQALVIANRNEALKLAIINNRLAIINLLLLFPDVQNSITEESNAIYLLAVRERRDEVINCLLNLPAVFSLAERNEYRQDGRRVYYHTTRKLADLENRKRRFEAAHRNGEFDVDLDEARLLFYMLRYLIRCSDQDFQRQIAFILSIPKVVSLLHQEITPGAPNELLQLAVRRRHRQAVTQLLTFPDVRRLAVANNYYNSTEIDLRQIAQNRESSMGALTPTEQAQVQLLEEKYRPEIDRMGGNNRVLMRLTAELRTRYLANPATINVRGEELLLPFSYDEFRALGLTAVEREQALRAYFAHPDHSASRFLSKPNLWIHPAAQYVEIDRQNSRSRWASFEEYLPMICCFWVAASDASAIGPENYSVEQRKALYIGELAGLARAHNWDNTRPIQVAGPLPFGRRQPMYLLDGRGNVVREEYDDGQLDQPSCGRGIKQRVKQSLHDHPLYRPLTIDVIEEEIRVMVIDHYRRIFDTRTDLKTIDSSIMAFTIDGEPLSNAVVELNVSESQIAEFIQKLKTRYKALFTANIGFEEHIKERFSLNICPSHIVNFYEMYQIGSLLAEAIEQARLRSPTFRSQQPSFFAGSAGAGAARRSSSPRKGVSFSEGVNAQAASGVVRLREERIPPGNASTTTEPPEQQGVVWRARKAH